MGCELSFYADSDPPTHCFNPCGHMASEKTVRYAVTVKIHLLLKKTIRQQSKCFCGFLSTVNLSSITCHKIWCCRRYSLLYCQRKKLFSALISGVFLIREVYTCTMYCELWPYYRYWSELPVPHGCQGFQAICPFCATPLCAETGFIKLIFQDNTDWIFCDIW